MDLRSVLLDVVKHTSGLGIIENIKVTGTGDETRLDAMDTDRTVILNAKLHDNVEEFQGEFGLGNLSLLNSLTKLSNYSTDDAQITVETRERNGETMPSGLLFKDEQGSKDQYRFMSKEIIDQAMTIGKFKGASWNVEFAPAQAKVSQMSEVAGIYSGIEPTFNVKTEDGAIVFEIGSAEGGILGRRKFADNIEGELGTVWSWNLQTFLNIVKLGMNGTCVVKFSDQGVCQIDVDSGIGLYSYILPATSK